MSTVDRVISVRGSAIKRVPADIVDNRTLEILEQRRRTAVIRRRGWLVRRALVLADVIGLIAAFFVTELIIDRGHSGRHLGELGETLPFVVGLPVWVFVAKLYGLYDRDEERTDHSTVDDLVGVFHVVTVGIWIVYASAYVIQASPLSFPKIAVFWAAAVVMMAISRGMARAYCRRRITYLQNALIVGAGEVGQLVARKLLRHPEYGVNIVGFVDDEPRERSDDLDHLNVLGGVGDVPSIVSLLDVDRVVIAFSNDSHEQLLDLMRSLKDLDVQIDVVPRLFELVGPNASMHTVEGLPLVGLPPLRLSSAALAVKRMADILVASSTLLALSPLFALVAWRIRRESPGPIFYKHERVGRDGRPFRLFKFRTMYIESCRGAEYGGEQAEAEFERLMSDERLREEFTKTYKLQDDPRVTPFGSFLRRTSIDELPQLLNVLRGEISLVGPRPVTFDEAARYGSDWESLLNIKPGVTGYWQINGRSELDYEDRVRLDVSYVTSWSLGLDFTILAKTVRVLLAREGAV